MKRNLDGLYRPLLRRPLNINSFVFRVRFWPPRASPRHADLLKEVSVAFSIFGHQAKSDRAAR
eukprot:4088998-Karenia_brevis.AAC.1